MWVNILAKPLRIPEAWGWLPMLAAVGCFILLFRLQKRIRMEKAGKQPTIAPLATRKKLFWIVAISLIAGSVGVLPLLPYTVDNFQPWIYAFVIPFQILVLAIFLPLFWRKLIRAGASEHETVAQK